jgi:hypothetical protein
MTKETILSLALAAQLSHRRENRAKRRDFYHRYDLLLANWYLLTNGIQQQILLVRQDLHDDLASWRPHQPEPDWASYANRVCMIRP